MTLTGSQDSIRAFVTNSRNKRSGGIRTPNRRMLTVGSRCWTNPIKYVQGVWLRPHLTDTHAVQCPIRMNHATNTVGLSRYPGTTPAATKLSRIPPKSSSSRAESFQKRGNIRRLSRYSRGCCWQRI